MDGQRQRQALTATERSLEHLGNGRLDEARRAAARAVELDQIGAFATLDEAVGLVATDLGRGESIEESHLEALAEAVGPGPLAGLIEPLRRRSSEAGGE